MASHRRSRRTPTRRTTFCEVLQNTRIAAAEWAWGRAVVAARVRYAATDARSRRILGRIKLNAIRHAMELAPGRVVTGIDGDFQLGLPSLRFGDFPRLHLPWAAVVHLPTNVDLPMAG